MDAGQERVDLFQLNWHCHQHDIYIAIESVVLNRRVISEVDIVRATYR